jgi:hypothetical protein
MSSLIRRGLPALLFFAFAACSAPSSDLPPASSGGGQATPVVARVAPAEQCSVAGIPPAGRYEYADDAGGVFSEVRREGNPLVRTLPIGEIREDSCGRQVARSFPSQGVSQAFQPHNGIRPARALALGMPPWQQTYYVNGVSSSVTCRHLGEEAITVPAGTFMTHVVECSDQRQDTTTPVLFRTYWHQTLHLAIRRDELQPRPRSVVLRLAPNTVMSQRPTS